MKPSHVRLAASLALMSLTLVLAGRPLTSMAQEGVSPAPESPVEAEAPKVPDEFLVRFRSGIPTARAQQVVSEQGAEHLRQVPALDVLVLRVPPGLTVEQAIRRFSRVPEVEYAEPNYILTIAAAGPGDDPGLENQWAPQKIEAPGGWASTSGDPAVTIAVVDTGIDYRHSELAPTMWTNPGEVANNGLDDDGNGKADDIIGWDYVNNDPDPLDDHSHGTHVAGIAAATDNANPAGLVGICPDCTLMAVKVLDASGSGPLDRIANGIIYAADEGAKVVNLSLGATAGMATLENAVNYAWDHGAVVVAAAGNNGVEQAFYPAAYPNAIAVASTEVDDYHSCYSNYGAFVDVAAPGEAIYSTLPLSAGTDAYGTYSGTSMAAPHVSGLAGLLFSQNSEGRTNAEVRTLIETTSVDLGSVGPDSHFGAGRINARRATEGDSSPTTPPPAGLASDQATASAYAHARKLARDSAGILHLAWHSKVGSQYRVLHSTSTDDGVTWSPPGVVFESSTETYHPALALDSDYVYLVFPSKNAQGRYEVLFTRKPLSAESWPMTTISLMGGAYDAVRPDIFADPSNGRIHIVGASLDNTRYVYYVASDTQGDSWGPLRQVDPTTPTTASNSRYAAVHAHGDNVTIAARTFAPGSYYYYLHTVRSTDGGASWFGQQKIASYWGFSASEYGISLAGIGDRLYMSYEVGYSVGGGVYFRRWDGASWSNYELVGPAGVWPTITQADDGQAWLIWQDGDNLLTRHYTGSAWEATETLVAGNALSKSSYPNLKLGTYGGRVEWVATNCKGAPFRLVVDGRDVATADGPPTVGIVSPADGSTVSGAVALQVGATDAEDAAGTLTVEWREDSGNWQPAAYDIGSGTYQASWDTTTTGDGAHTLTARAIDSAGNSAFSSVGVTVDNNEPPVASFTAACIGLSCHFDASASSDPDGTIVGYGWDYGDAATGSGNPADHVYAEAGTYLVVLTVTDDGGAMLTDSKTVSPASPPETVHVGDLDGNRTKERNKWTAIVTVAVHDADHGPVADATVTGAWSNGASGAGGCVTDAGGTCSLSRSGISTRVPSVDFRVDTVSHATLGYAPSDNHDAEGDSNGTVIRVYLEPPVNQPPVASFVYACTDHTCEFDATGSYDPDGAIASYIWDWGDGGTGEGVATSYTYLADGSYAVLLTVADNGGAMASQAQTVRLGDAGPVLHVGDLDGSPVVVNKKFWKATVTITVHDAGDAPLAGATVWAIWSGSASGSGFCLTDAAGQCLLASGNIAKGSLPATLTVDDVTLAGYAYDPLANHDPDGDSDGTSIMVAPVP